MSVFFLIYFSLPYQLGYFSPVISTPLFFLLLSKIYYFTNKAIYTVNMDSEFTTEDH